VSCTTADYNFKLEASSREAGAAAELAASNKVVKYAGLSSQGEFVPIAVEPHGPINRDALQSLSDLGRRLLETTGDDRASSFVFQRISVVEQRFNSALKVHCQAHGVTHTAAAYNGLVSRMTDVLHS